jgi:hypothetical protein
MKAENNKNIFFVLYILTVLVLAVIYFSVPERKELLDFNIRWWKEFWRALGSISCTGLVI